ncbi:hypothetical protein [Paraliobacillus ryukyuensis]|uniref:hypothetical protein n=1 Tax=Paraliobacillus ryukyuensis TaxID=200904 RepID=UPI0009A869D8|nr:hypothetical protein [Paraliobacillus ryukyuensis]
MKVFVVLYESFNEKETDVLDVYTDEEKANNRVKYERELIGGNPSDCLRDECWYQERSVVK